MPKLKTQIQQHDEEWGNITMYDETIANNQRRRFMRASVIGLVIAPVGNLLFNRSAEARGSRAITGEPTEIPRLPESDQQASSLGYKEDAALVDTTKYKKVEGQTCRNCQLYSGSEGDEWGPCAIFSYRLHPTLNRNFVVSAKGWCRSWGPRTG